jgi:hypothetical protein
VDAVDLEELRLVTSVPIPRRGGFLAHAYDIDVSPEGIRVCVMQSERVFVSALHTSRPERGRSWRALAARFASSGQIREDPIGTAFTGTSVTRSLPTTSRRSRCTLQMVSTVTLFNSLSSLAPTAAAERGPSVALVERFSGSLGLTDFPQRPSTQSGPRPSRRVPAPHRRGLTQRLAARGAQSLACSISGCRSRMTKECSWTGYPPRFAALENAALINCES